MSCYNYPESLVNQDEISIELTSSSGTNYILNEHEDVDQYGPYAIASDIMPCYSYPASLANQNDISFDLSC